MTIVVDGDARDSRLADPPWKTQSGPNPLLDQKWTTGGDKGPNFEKKIMDQNQLIEQLTRKIRTDSDKVTCLILTVT